MSDLKVETTQSALASIAKHREEETSDNSIHVGYVCQNPGCDKVYENEESNKQQCTYHSGIAIFHEGMKYWSCCERKTSDFGAFLEQKGCTTGEHKWGKNEKVSRIREDWFCRAGHIHLNIYCKGALPDKCYVKSNGLILSGKVVHGFGTKSTDLNYELFGEIVPSESKVIIGERKLEIILKQAGTEAWPRLTYETKIDERAEGDNAA
ncbi:hypothetical protein AB6A40_009531 [Gnathostoma spinigerum]|uniref:Cysteine and histidine-rich domain-containing protein n=1 Tax=Gnathostoma spinigerum TaxID=75299 RepID=A0ABD6F0Z8_9BILA